MSRSTHEATLRTRFAQAEWVSRALAQLRDEWRLDRHPFLRRWLAGGLDAGDLQLFAAEHHHVVMALEELGRGAAALSDGLLAEQLIRYADAQERSVELSCDFAAATGWGRSAWYFAEDPLAPTLACARTLRGDGGSLAHRLVTIQATESVLGQLAPRQFGALVELYGFDGCSARYFHRLVETGPRHAAVCEAALASLLPLAAPQTLVRRAEMACRSYRELLDGVQMRSGVSR